MTTIFKTIDIYISQNEMDLQTIKGTIWGFTGNEIYINVDPREGSILKGTVNGENKSVIAKWNKNKRSFDIEPTVDETSAWIYPLEAFSPYEPEENIPFVVKWEIGIDNFNSANFNNGNDAEQFADILRRNGYQTVIVVDNRFKNNN